MAEHSQPNQPPIDHEIDSRSIGKIGVWLAVVTVAGFVIAWGFYLALASSEKKLDAPPSPIAEAQAPRAVPGPGLTARPEVDLAAYQLSEEKILHGWAWVDRDGGVARVPVESALERVAAAGALPDFSQPLEIVEP